MSLKDLKAAASTRQQEAASPAPAPVGESSPAEVASAPDGRTKLLGARVPLAVHREWVGHLYRAQEQQPDLTTQSAMPVLIRLLRDEAVWEKFMAELAKS